MVDRRQVLRAVLLGTAGLAVPAACGVPSGGAPMVDGNGPSYNSTRSDNVNPPQPADATDPTILVKLFLQSVSGRLDDETRKSAQDRARKFMTAAAAASWNPNTNIILVRTSGFMQSTGDNDYRVTFTMRQIGLLSNQGEAIPLPAGSDSRPIQVSCTVGPDQDPENKTGETRLITHTENLPSSLLLDADTLDTPPVGPGYFQPALIYFWDTAHRDLVPDLRYLPLVGSSVGQEQTQLATWLASGPSQWLSSAVTTLPGGTTVAGNVVPNKDGLVVNLAGSNLQNQNVDLRAIVKQLRASLAPLGSQPIQLQINAQAQPISDTDNYREANLADVPAHPDGPEMFCILNGSVRPVNGSASPPVINGVEQNKNVSSAALGRDQRLAALVHSDGKLLIGAAGDSGAAPVYLQPDLSGLKWSRPAWLPVQSGQPARLLVAVDGKLYQVGPDGAVAQVSTSAPVRTFAVGADGHRLAWLDTDGTIWVAPVQNDNGTVQVGSARSLSVGLSELSGVAWSRPERIVVAGKDGGSYAVCELSIDGALYYEWDSRFTSPINTITGYPRPISVTAGQIWVLVEVGNAAHHLGRNSDQPVDVVNTPTASPSSGTVAPAVRSPFFLD